MNPSDQQQKQDRIADIVESLCRIQRFTDIESYITTKNRKCGLPKENKKTRTRPDVSVSGCVNDM